jgi:gp187
MKIITTKVTPWSGAISTYNTIQEAGKEEEFESLIEELYPNGIEETQLNDILWFESDYILESLGLSEEETDFQCDSCLEYVEEDELWAHNDGCSYCSNCYPNI